VVHALPTDSEAVKKALDEPLNVEAWINGLSLEDAENLEKLTIKNSDRGNHDAVLMQYVQYLPALVAVQAHSHFNVFHARAGEQPHRGVWKTTQGCVEGAGEQPHRGVWKTTQVCVEGD
jgi:hypothetical protein